VAAAPPQALDRSCVRAADDLCVLCVCTRQIPDPEDKKPEGWDDVPAQIPDPEVS
jgi:hypothetical protein